MARVNGVRCYGHVLRRDNMHVLREALELEVKGKRKMQVEKDSRSVGLKKEDALSRVRWRVELGEIAARVDKSGYPRLRG